MILREEVFVDLLCYYHPTVANNDTSVENVKSDKERPGLYAIMMLTVEMGEELQT